MTRKSKSPRKHRIPSLCLHKATGQAVVRLDGKDVYCGRCDTAEAQEKYERAIAEWLVTRQRLSGVAEGAGQIIPTNLTVSGLVLAYWSRHVTTY